jgi:hypothetical protein
MNKDYLNICYWTWIPHEELISNVNGGEDGFNIDQLDLTWRFITLLSFHDNSRGSLRNVVSNTHQTRGNVRRGYYSLVWCGAVYFGTTAQTLQRIAEEPPYATSKTKKAGVDYVCLATVGKEMVSLCNALVCHADSLYQRQICVTETSDEARITKKKSLC